MHYIITTHSHVSIHSNEVDVDKSSIMKKNLWTD